MRTLSFQRWRGWVKRRDVAPRRETREDGRFRSRTATAQMTAAPALQRQATKGNYRAKLLCKLLRQVQIQCADTRRNVESDLTLH